MTLKVWLKHFIAAFKMHYSKINVVQWSTFYAVVLCIHTLVNKSWKSLVTDIAGDGPTPDNGLISGCMYTAAVLCLLLLLWLGDSVLTHPVFCYGVLCGGPFICAILFLILGLCNQVWVAALMLVIYNALAECVLVVASVMLAKSMREAALAKPKVPQLSGSRL